MIAVKKINNNFVVCQDDDGNELIAFGVGIGYGKIPYEITDKKQIKRTFYGVNPTFYGLLNEIPDNIFEISTAIVDYAKRRTDYEFSPNIIFTLADHINFSVQRLKNGMPMSMPFVYDMEHLYEVETDIGRRAVRYIDRKLKIHLPSDEAVGIALHFINERNVQATKQGQNDQAIIQEITEIVEADLGVSIDQSGFNYSRFATHIQYLLKRQGKGVSIESDNEKLYVSVKDEYPKSYECVLKILDYFEEKLGWQLSDEEQLYLLLHVNRLYEREDCNQ